MKRLVSGPQNLRPLLLALGLTLALAVPALAYEQGPSGPQPPPCEPGSQCQPPPNGGYPGGGPGGPGGGPGECRPGPGGPGGPGSGPPPGGDVPPASPSSLGDDQDGPDGPDQGGPGDGPGGPDDGGPGGKPGCDFEPGFLNRVWKFVGEVDSYNDGELSITLDKILNLPKRFKDQDDGLVDQDMLVLVGDNARVYTKQGRRTKRVAKKEVDDALGDAEHVRVHGKMLRPKKWHKDQDDSPVPTVRAKKVYVLN